MRRMWVDWDDEKLKADNRFKLIFIRRSGQEVSDYMEKEVLTENLMKAYSGMYMPVLVDSDERPDVVTKYGANSVPSITITTVDGRVLSRGGLTDYKSFTKFMIELGILINKERKVIEEIAAEDIEEDQEEEEQISHIDKSEMKKDVQLVVDKLIDSILKTDLFDTPGLLNALEYLIRNNEKEKAKKVVSMLEEKEDKVEGGIFSGNLRGAPLVFSTMKETHLNIRYARLLADFAELVGENKYKEKSEQILQFFNSLLGPSGLYFHAISEDSDYYRSSKDVRDLKQKPKVERRILFNVNAKVAEELCLLGKVEMAKKVMEKLEENLTEKINGRIYKVYHSDRRNVSNLVIDVACGISAYSTLYSLTAERTYKDKVLEMLSLINSKKGKRLFFEFDRNGFGFMKKRKVDVLGNISIARGFKRIGMDTEEMEISLLKFIRDSLDLEHLIDWLI